MIPQLIFLFLITMGLGIQITKHGQQKEASTYNGNTGMINYVITLILLYWGGFFNLH